MKASSKKKKAAATRKPISVQQQSRLQVFFSTMLQEIYWAEQHLVDVLGTMETAASTLELKDAFRQHQQETREHVERLESIFAKTGLPAEPKLCLGVQGLFDEGWQVIDETPAGTAERDVALIIAAQKVEHYEIAAYGSLRALARTLNLEEVGNLLGDTLTEEDAADSLLTSIAEDQINYEASQEIPEAVEG